jgi:hypothetical protein
MKKNLLLSLFLVALLVLTYFIQEKRVNNEYEAALVEGKVLQEEITQLKLPYLEAVKREGSWWHEGQLLSHNDFKQIETRLNQLKAVKTIEGNWNQIAEEPLAFEVNKAPWALGQLSLDKSSFYLKSGDKISLAFIDGEGSSLGTSAEAIEIAKLNELKTLLTQNLNELIEKQLFRYYPKLNPQIVKMNTEGSLPFEINLKANTTNPSPIEGVKVYPSLASNFLSLLTQIMIEEEIPYSEKLKVKKLSQIVMLNADGSETEWEVWLRSQEKADAALLDEKNKRAFLMVGGSLKVFFVGLQGYWDKKVIPPQAFKSFDRLSTTLSQGERSAVVTVLNREPLDFEVEKFKVKRGHMSDLFYFVFNLGSRDQADRVSQLTKSERKQLLSGNHLRMEVMGQELLFWRKEHELIVVNLTQGFKAHFTVSGETFRANFEDVLE